MSETPNRTYTLEETLALIENPEIRKLVISLQRMPQVLAERERQRLEHKEFVRRVWEKACRDAGLVK